jgi:hypothetical protein
MDILEGGCEDLLIVVEFEVNITDDPCALGKLS